MVVLIISLPLQVNDRQISLVVQHRFISCSLTNLHDESRLLTGVNQQSPAYAHRVFNGL